MVSVKFHHQCVERRGWQGLETMGKLIEVGEGVTLCQMYFGGSKFIWTLYVMTDPKPIQIV